MEVLTELTEVPSIVARAYRTHKSSGYGYECPTELIEVPGTGMKVFRNFQKFQLFWHGRTEPTKVPGRHKNALPVPRVLWYSRTDFTEVPGTGMNVVQISQTQRSCTDNTRAKYTPPGEEFDLKWRISSNLHGMFSLGQRPRGNP